MADDDGGGGAPAWMTTYGDMITLLLCFFVILLTMMEMKKDKVTRTSRQFQKQFGVLPAYRAQQQVFKQPQTMTDIQAFVLRRGPKGKTTSVKQLGTINERRSLSGEQNCLDPIVQNLLHKVNRCCRRILLLRYVGIETV